MEENKPETVPFTHEESIKCYPNPSNEWIAVEAIDESWRQAEVVITDITGKVIQRFTLQNRMYVWDVRDVPEGLYLVRATKNGQTQSLKVNVVH